MPVRTARKQLAAVRSAVPGYLSALSSGYLLTVGNMLAQFVLTPFYLRYLGESQFGVLMMLLGAINFAAVGLGWMSGGLVRVLGERWATHDRAGFITAFAVGKYVYVAYATLTIGLGLAAWSLGVVLSHGNAGSARSILLAAAYFLLAYENIPERQAFIAANRQVVGNRFELGRLLLSTVVVLLSLPRAPHIDTVWYAMIAGMLAQRAGTAAYWKQQVPSIGWRRFAPEMIPLLRRLAGRQGAGYVVFGMIGLSLQADTLIVGILGGASLAGKFVLLWRIPEALGTLISRVPSTMEPRIIQLDAVGERQNLLRMFVRGRRWYVLLVLCVAICYALVGRWLTALWVGANAPADGWMYVAAATALFFGALSKWPVSFSYALISLPRLNLVAGLELAGKLALIVLLLPHFGIAAPVLAAAAVHVLYAAYLYQKLAKFWSPSMARHVP